LGLSRGVTEWLEPPDSPLYDAIGAIERFLSGSPLTFSDLETEDPMRFANLVLAVLLLSSAAPAFAQSPASAPVSKAGNLVALHVDQNDPAVMALALNNAENVVAEFKSIGQPVTVEIVTYGPGLHMLRNDTSPVKARIAAIALEQPQITFSACGNTQERMSKAEGKPVSLMAEATVQKSGVVRLMQLQAQGYAYIKP
jgi:uncharacterized protein